MAAGRKTGGRVAGVPNKRTLARRLAEAQAAATLSKQSNGNSLALLQALYKNTELNLRTRLDAAKAALPYEVPKVESGAAKPTDHVPLHERLREYARVRDELKRHGKLVDVRRLQIGEAPAPEEVTAKHPGANDTNGHDGDGAGGNVDITHRQLPRWVTGDV